MTHEHVMPSDMGYFPESTERSIYDALQDMDFCPNDMAGCDDEVFDFATVRVVIHHEEGTHLIKFADEYTKVVEWQTAFHPSTPLAVLVAAIAAATE